MQLRCLFVFLLAPPARGWELGRFVKQALFFNNPLRPKTSPATAAPVARVLMPRDGVEWGPLDDVVMGGASSSSWLDGPPATWAGTVTCEGGGGFAGARCQALRPPVDASKSRGVKLRGLRNTDAQKVRRYKFIVRDDEAWNGVAWTWTVDVRGDRAKDFQLPFDEAVPTRFAKTLTGVQLDTSKLTGLQLTYSKFEFDGGINPTFTEGPFGLEVASIELYN
ncbi:complex I intermediate-associated protein 30-domain-containing protein [Pelagophyceae sp. CCMP2097]|nr:complex I intermediate-associated protein 30-domain-containing protein [Pelagophyceae sp. CCMP2097]